LGTNLVSPLLTDLIADFAKTFAFTYHWSNHHGSIIEFDLSPYGTVLFMVSTFSNKFKLSSFLIIFSLALNLSKPSNSFVPFLFIVPFSLKILII